MWLVKQWFSWNCYVLQFNLNIIFNEVEISTMILLVCCWIMRPDIKSWCKRSLTAMALQYFIIWSVIWNSLVQCGSAELRRNIWTPNQLWWVYKFMWCSEVGLRDKRRWNLFIGANIQGFVFKHCQKVKLVSPCMQMKW